jgi:hypothetical protein
VIVAGGLGACEDGAEEEVGTTAAPDETVPAATKDPALVFDGTSCHTQRTVFIVRSEKGQLDFRRVLQRSTVSLPETHVPPD